MKPDQEFFKKFNFQSDEIERYLQSALHDLEIAEKDRFSEVKFTYSYQALIKTGIALLAKIEKVKVRSMPGHHMKIIEKMSEILEDEDVAAIGNAMRMKRNTDLHGGGELIGEKEAEDYLEFVRKVIEKSKKVIGARD